MRSVNEYLYDGESVCIGRKGTIDNPIFLTGKFWTVDTLFYTHSFKNCLPWFMYLVFQNIDWKTHNEAGGVPSLSKTNIEKIPVLVPDLPEQQKIAACLSSLDALIAAHADKLDVLKTHKKGLMQQFFPREGETVPRLRFPEFREAGEWEEKKLSELFAFRNGLNADKEKYGKGHKYISVLDIISGKPITYDSIHSSVEITEKELELFKVEYGDIVFQRSSETQDEAGQASVYLDRKKAAIFGGFVIRGKRISDYHPLFMSALLASAHVRKEISSHSAGSTRYNIGQETLSVIAVLIPSLPEQQKIAACLCSLDALITAQAEKIEALKTNKKGLMQQLFPSPEA